MRRTIELVTCPHCGGHGHAADDCCNMTCCLCEGAGRCAVDAWWWTLCHNLAQAGGLCAPRVRAGYTLTTLSESDRCLCDTWRSRGWHRQGCPGEVQ